MNLQKIIKIFLFINLNIIFQFSYALQPSDIWNQVFHFDMKNLDNDNNSSTQPVDNQSIDQLIDQANSHTGSQLSTSKQALFDAAWFSNRWGLLFDGINDLYTIQDHQDITVADEYSEKSFAVVIQTSSDISRLQTIYEQWGKDKWYAIQIENNKMYIWVWNSIDWPVWEQFKIADLWTIQENKIYNIIAYQNSNWDNNFAAYLNATLIKNILNVSSQKSHWACVMSGSFDCYMFANGWSIGIGATKNDTLRLSNQTEQIVDESHFYQGHIWELISWNTQLNSTQVQWLFEYFDTKWWIKKPQITIQKPEIIWSVSPGNSQIYISYNDFQNWAAIDISTDKLELYKWNWTDWWNNIANSFINFSTKEITNFEAKYDAVWLTQWKYKLIFRIEKINGEFDVQQREFFVGLLSPEEIQNPVFHYDAQDINADNNFNNNPVNNSRVQTLVDKFNGYNAIQNNTSNRPILEENIINNFSAIKFNGSNQYFDIANTADINTRNNPPYTQKTFAAVFKTWNDINSFQTIYEQWWNARWYSFVVDNGHVYAWVWNTSEWDNGHKYKSVDLWIAQPNTTYFAMIVQDSQSNIDEQNTLKIYLNWNLSSVQNHVDAQRNHPGAISIWRVNGNSVSASTNTVVGSSWHFFDGYIWELISWNFALDQAEVNGIQEYFSQKWWIVLFSEKFPIPSPTSDTTPTYTFISNRVWNLNYTGSCSSTTTQANIWENIINLSADNTGSPLNNGIYDDCSIILTDENGFTHVLNITPFEVIATSYTLTELSEIVSPSANHFPEYAFSSPIEWQIEYFWTCSSNTNFAVVWNNTITFNYLPDWNYDNCYLRVNNGGAQQSEYLLITPFIISSSAPVFWNINIANGELLASKNNILEISYSDSWSLNLSSANLQIQKYNSVSANWWNDISSLVSTQNNISQNQATYQINVNEFWKYRFIFSIENIYGTYWEISQDFFIDEPSFSVDSSQINMWNINSQNINFSTPVEIRVETLWAEFDMKIKKSWDFSSHNNTINQFNGNTWYGYDSTPLDWNLTNISNVETFANQSKNINVNWEKNIYTYYIRLGAIIDELQSAGDYSGNIQFGIQLIYD